MRWEKQILRGQNDKNLPDSTLWHPPLFPPTSRRWKSQTHQLWKLEVKILVIIRAMMVMVVVVMMKWMRKEEAEAVDNLLKNRDVEKIAFQAHSMIHLNIYGLLFWLQTTSSALSKLQLTTDDYDRLSSLSPPSSSLPSALSHLKRTSCSRSAESFSSTHLSATIPSCNACNGLGWFFKIR